jgi:hypothetical protein
MNKNFLKPSSTIRQSFIGWLIAAVMHIASSTGLDP